MKKTGKLLSFILATVGVLAVTLSLVACGTTPDTPDDTGKNPPAHTHTYATEWSKDETNHWHAATCDHKTEVKDKAEHTFNKTECTVCGYPAPVVVKCSCETKCELCPECGGCIQTDCTDEKCIKCGTGLTSHEFKAIEGKIKHGMQFEDGTFWKLNPNIHTECTAHKAATATSTGNICNVDDFVTGIWGSAGGSVTYEITSNKKTTVTLRVLATSHSTNHKLSDAIKIILNDDLIETNARLNIVPNGYKDKLWFYYVTVGCVELQEGLNTIEFMGLADPQAGCNISRIDLMTEAGVTLGFTPQAMPAPDADGVIQDENTKWNICKEQV